VSSVSAVSFDPYDYAMHDDPYPVYARLRDEAPLYRNDEQDFWALSRHADVVAAFREPTRFSSANGVSIDPAAWGPRAHRISSFLALDPPRHTRMRALVSKGFTPRRVRDLQDSILGLTRRYLDRAIGHGSFEEADRAELRRLADTTVHRDAGVHDVPPAGVEAALTLVGYYADLVRERRRSPKADLTSALVTAEIDGDRPD
jgi:cytochrome P450